MSFLRFTILLLILLGTRAVFLQPTAAQNSPTASSIHNVDFENFTYPLPKDLIEPTDHTRSFKLKNGKHPGNQDELDISLGKITYGDVTGDHREEAILFMSILTGGTALPGIIYVYTMQGGRPKMLWNFSTGDRAFGGYRNAYAQNERLVIELFHPKSGDGNCCPTQYIRTTYEWRGKQFRPRRKQTFSIPQPK